MLSLPGARTPAVAASCDAATDAEVTFTAVADRDGDSLRLRVEGEIDLFTGPVLAEQLEAADRESPDALVLDLDGVSFMDSTGLSLMLGALARAETGGYRFALGRPPEQVRRLLDLVGMTPRVHVEA